ncbi:CAP domain-containing protein [Streptomyces spirodelae]|uniref:CAP domain-containing protein n=1 Tax=Streptomyces spirodelae TaxID=2812904 RepID=A0ABS3WNE9_9ACTN|nr:CAP domain-containing protein [Streptomyces spirodelae]MBO8184637.1 CAP domain-containing protein [Streptomyces spirodelae]
MESAIRRRARRGAALWLALTLAAGTGWTAGAGPAHAEPPPVPPFRLPLPLLWHSSGSESPPPHTGNSHTGRPRTGSAKVLRLVNVERARAHCPRVTEHRALRRAAQRHSVRMARARQLSHTRPEHAGPGRRLAREGYRFGRVGENIARGQRSAAGVVRAWMRSPKHRATLTNCAFREAGVGVSSGPGGPWWALMLASKRR